MKVETANNETAKKYPYLGWHESSGRIVLFTAPKSGVQLNVVIGTQGEYCTYWSEEDFTPFTGTVTLSND